MAIPYLAASAEYPWANTVIKLNLGQRVGVIDVLGCS